MRQLEFQGQRLIAGADTAHEDIATTAGVFGQRMRADIDSQSWCVTWGEVIGGKGQASAPGVVQCRQHPAGLAHAHQFAQVGKFERD